MRCQERESLYSGGFGSGKSWALCARVLALTRQHPGIRILVGRARNPMLRQTTMRDFEELCPREWVREHRKVEQLYRMDNGSEVLFRQVQNADELKGLTLGAAALDEWTEVPEQSTMTLRGRLRQPGMPGMLFGVTNPGGRIHYLYKQFVDSTERRRTGRVWMTASSLENTDTPQAYRDSLLQSYQGRDLQRFVEGEWIDPDSIVWDTFDRAKCTGPAPYLPPGTTVETSTDFGHEHWWVTLWGAWIPVRHEGETFERLLVYRQYWGRRRTLEEHVEAIQAHNAEDRDLGLRLHENWLESDPQTQHELRRMDDPIKGRTALKAFVPGIRAVRGGFLPAPDGFPRIILCAEKSRFSPKDAPDLADQVESYQRPEGETREDRVLSHDSKGESIDDGPDALRYLFYSRAQASFDRQANYDPGMDELSRRRLYVGRRW